MSKSCATCVWFNADFAPDDDDPSLALGLCEWPVDRLPYALRYGSREGLAVHPTDGESCNAHEPTIDRWKNITLSYRVYCLKHGVDHPDEMLARDRERWPGGCMTGYILWVHEQWRKFEIDATIPEDVNLGLWRLQNRENFNQWLLAYHRVEVPS